MLVSHSNFTYVHFTIIEHVLKSGWILCCNFKTRHKYAALHTCARILILVYGVT